MLNTTNELFPNTSSRPTPTNKTDATMSGWKPTPQLKNVLIAIYAVVFVMGVFGNAMVCYILGVKKRRKRQFDILLISLSIADLLASFAGPITMIADLAGDHHVWYFGAFLCKVLPAISPITLFASSWTLAMISCDRFRVVTRKTKKDLDARLTAVELAIIWSSAIAVTIPYIIGSKFINPHCSTYAIWDKDKWVIYVGFWVVLGWGIPLIVISLFCCMVLRNLKRRMSRRCDAKIQKKRVQRNRRVLKMFLIVVFSFFFFTTPYATFYFVVTYVVYLRPGEMDMRLVQEVNCLLFVSMMANSCINPIVYAKMHKEVNKTAMKGWNFIHHAFSHVLRRITRQRNGSANAETEMAMLGKPETSHIRLGVSVIVSTSKIAESPSACHIAAGQNTVGSPFCNK